jgi:hypothetical protein
MVKLAPQKILSHACLTWVTNGAKRAIRMAKGHHHCQLVRPPSGCTNHHTISSSSLRFANGITLQWTLVVASGSRQGRRSARAREGPDRTLPNRANISRQPAEAITGDLAMTQEAGRPAWAVALWALVS